jgi:lipopolysaccharide transport system ATP-binding protein
MKVRLAFSVAAHLEPEILVIDEVLAVGDSEFQKKCMGKMEDVTGQGRTVLFVSHNMGAVQELCSRGILLSYGQMQMNQNIGEVVSNYLQNNISKKTSIDFSNRTGTGNVRVSDLYFCDENNNKIDNVITGQPLTINIKYYSSMPEIRNVIIGLVITNSLGQFLAVLNNKMSNYNFKNIPGKGEIKCIVRKLPLMSGIHFLNVNLNVNGIKEDFIEAAKRFNVENADYYLSGFPNAYNRQGIYIDQEWMSC